MEAEKVQWGMLGTGMVAGWLQNGFKGCQKSDLAAVASRSAEKAKAFAEKHGISKSCGSYEELLADPSIQAVLITLPNTLHLEWVEKAAAAGKHVLCEKPLAMRGADVEKMIAVCRSRGVKLMEAAMYRFQPQIRGVLDKVAAGRIGHVRLVQAAFSWPFHDKANIRLRKDMGGGCLFDLGFYPVSFAVLVSGQAPTIVMGSSVYGETGCDEVSSALLHFGNGIAAVVECGFRIDVKICAEITGEKGRIVLPDPWTARGTKKEVQIFKSRKVEETLQFEDPNAYTREIDHFSEVIRGEAENLWPPEQSLLVIRTLEDIASSARISEAVRF